MVDWDVKHQHKQTNQTNITKVNTSHFVEAFLCITTIKYRLICCIISMFLYASCLMLSNLEVADQALQLRSTFSFSMWTEETLNSD